MSHIEDADEKKVPRYLQFYKHEWERLPIFKGWLASVPGSKHRAYCKYCRKDFRAHRTDLRSHAKSRKHQKASDLYLCEDKTACELVAQPTPVEVPTINEKKSHPPLTSVTVSAEGSSDRKEHSPTTSDSLQKKENSQAISYSSYPPSVDSVGVLDKINNKKIRDCSTEGISHTDKEERKNSKNEDRDCRISTQVLDLVRGIPVSRLGVSLLYEKNNTWKQLGDGITDTDGQWYNVFSNKEIRVGRYKLHFETKKYFILGLHDTFYPYIEVVFDIAESIQQYHVPLLVSPFGYMVYRGGK